MAVGAPASQKPNDPSPRELQGEIVELRRRLHEVEATLQAIRQGKIDAVVVETHDEPFVYTVESADLPYRQFLDQMSEGAVSLDAHNAIVYCNRALGALLGQERDSLLGSDFARFVAAESREAYRNALLSERPERLGANLLAKDGRTCPVQVSCTPIGPPEARRFVLVISDMTERERVRELAEAREASEAASLAKDEFLAVVGHELRTPLGVIMGWTQVVLGHADELDPSTRKALETIDRNARLQRKLIEDLLDVSRVASGKLRLERSDLDFCELAGSAVAALGLTARSKGVELDVQVAPRIHVNGDPERLEQILQNLLGNAIKFTPTGGRVRLRIEQAGNKARAVVSDSGRGIAPELLPRIFQLFRQGEAIRRRAGGLGLGLSISKRLVELHDGQIFAESEGIGKGATFTVELPALPPRPESTPAPPGERTVSDELLARARVLIVDDEQDIRDITARFLESFGVEVVSVADTASALAWLEREEFDLVVSDLMMPGVDGLDLARELRKRHGNDRPMLAISALPAREYAERALDAGFSAFLSKPVESQTLRRIIAELLSNAAARAQAAR
ncbi:MAG TPA: ATP-binding protein [Polyangiaceae bacterium]